MSGSPGEFHRPVLLDEVVEAIAPAAGKVIVDGTFGAGGYSRAFLDGGASVFALDRDPRVRVFADALGPRLQLVERRFSELDLALRDAGMERCDGVALDIGVSSMQLDEPGRGFSFMRDGPLDMRMGQDGPTAADLVNESPTEELARVFFLYGEERQSRRVATAIGRRRLEQPFERTLDLAEVVERALGGRRGAPVHPATRVFQALRIAVNDELGELESGLAAAERALAPGGRLAVVTFHSLEDRIVKSFLIERSGAAPAGSRHLPPAPGAPQPTFELLFRGARAPSQAELADNPRARSAKLRAARRTAAPALKSAA